MSKQTSNTNGKKKPNDHRYIIVSLKYGENGILCFWRPNNAGYTNDLQQAGRYSEEEVRADLSYYHNGENVAIEETILLSDFKIRISLENNYMKVRKYKKLAKLGILSSSENAKKKVKENETEE